MDSPHPTHLCIFPKMSFFKRHFFKQLVLPSQVLYRCCKKFSKSFQMSLDFKKIRNLYSANLTPLFSNTTMDSWFFFLREA